MRRYVVGNKGVGVIKWKGLCVGHLLIGIPKFFFFSVGQLRINIRGGSSLEPYIYEFTSNLLG